MQEQRGEVRARWSRGDSMRACAAQWTPQPSRSRGRLCAREGAIGEDTSSSLLHALDLTAGDRALRRVQRRIAAEHAAT